MNGPLSKRVLVALAVTLVACVGPHPPQTADFSNDHRERAELDRCREGEVAPCHALARKWIEEHREASPIAALLTRGCQLGDGTACFELQSQRAFHSGDTSELSELCATGPVQACASLASIAFEKKEFTEAREAEALGCRRGAAASCATLGADMYWGRGGDRQIDAGRKLMADACAGGDGPGCLYAGFAATRAGEPAEPWYRRGCAAGEEHSCLELALSSLAGKDCTQAEAIAKPFCKDASSAACAIIATCRDEPDRIPCQPAQKTDGERSDSANFGCRTLGVYFSQRADPSRAARAWATACERHDPASCRMLGELLEREGNGLEDGVALAQVLAQACQNASIDEACTEAAKLYTAGVLLPQSPEYARKLREVACDHGFADACVEKEAPADDQ